MSAQVAVGAALFLLGWWRTGTSPLRIPATWAAAAASAWLAADVADLAPALAATSALLTLSFTPVGSIRSTVTDTAVVLAGMLAGIGLMDVLGPHAWVAGLAAVGGWGLAQTFGVPDATAIKIPAGAIAVFALGQIPDTGTVAARMGALLLGGAVGTVLSAVRTPNPVKTVEADLAGIAERTAALMSELAGRLGPGQHLAADLDGWAGEQRALVADLDAAAARAGEAQRTRQWSPWATAADTGRVTVTVNSLRHAHEQIRALLNTLADTDRPIAAGPVAQVLEAASEAFAARADTLTGAGAAGDLDAHVDRVADVSRAAAGDLRRVDDTQELLISGAIVGGLARSVYGLGDDDIQAQEAPDDVLPAAATWFRRPDADE